MTTTEVSLSYQLQGRYCQNSIELPAHLDQAGLIPESQCGFRKDRGTIYIRQLQENCQEETVDLYMTFIDLIKAFDTVSRDGLWKIMAKLVVHADT